MQTVTFECEIITPMFMAGADGQTPELRPPSIKGALRFWWRAMHGHLSLEELKKKEDEIFGSAAGEYGKKSSVTIKASLDETESSSFFNFIDSKDTYSKGIEYLAYTFFNQNKERKAFAPGTKFKVIISTQNRENLLSVIYAFGNLSVLGGLGTRSRRGMGSFCITKIIMEGIEKKDTSFYKVSSEGKIVMKNFESLIQTLNSFDNQGIGGQKFSHIINAQVVYSTGSNLNNWKDALSAVGNLMYEMRDKHPDGSKFTKHELNQKAAFGLPIMVRNDAGNPVSLAIDDDTTRRASPLVISVNKIKSNYYWTVIRLKGVFMPDDAEIVYPPNMSWDSVNYDLLNDYMSALEELPLTKSIFLRTI